MDYEKKYKEALEKARQLCAYPTTKPFISDLQDLFPELKESEDEKIRKEIIYHIKNCDDTIDGETEKRMIAWLEKQGEQKATDTVEPKFKVGDWIISKYMHLVMQILNNDNESYKTVETDGTERNDSYDFIERNFKLWTIQDAKDGDVLAEHETIVLFKKIEGQNISCYCTYHYLGFNPVFYVDTLQNKNPYRPATKEQRDTLERAMTNAGYRWNKEELKLEKI